MDAVPTATASAPPRQLQEASIIFVTDPDSQIISESPYYAESTSINNNSNELLSVNSCQQKEDEGRLARWCHWLRTIDGMVAVTFFCSVMARALPVLLVPIAVEEEVIEDSGNDDDSLNAFMKKQIAAQVAHITSMAFTGGAIGKFVNGFVCQRMGTYWSSKWYLTGLSLSSLLFSFSHNAETMGVAYAGMEFFSSIQYGSLAVMLTTYYTEAEEHAQLAHALTALGLASTLGEVVAKIAGTFLAGAHHWRIVSKIGAAVALLGAVLISQAPGHAHAEEITRKRHETRCCNSVFKAIHSILERRHFWILAFAYSMVFVCACVDRILVSFYYEMTHLPHNICGGLTLSVTVGLVHGLISGSKKYATLENLGQKISFLRNRYLGNFASALALALLSYYGPIYASYDAAILRKIVVASGVFVLSTAMASSVAFQFFQLPAMIAQEYRDNKAVCISWLEGIGYLFSIPTYRFLVYIVPQHGWPIGWVMLTTIFALGGAVMLGSIGPILDISCFYDDDQKRQQDPLRFFDWAINVYDTVVPDEMCYGTEFMTNRYMPETPRGTEHQTKLETNDRELGDSTAGPIGKLRV